MQIRLWAIIGPNNSGKSSTVGALVSQTGKGSGGFRSVFLRGGGWIYIHARRQSIQEAGHSVVASATKFEQIGQLAASNYGIAYLNLLLAFRSDSINGLPPAKDYLKHYIVKGWQIESLVLLDMNDEYDRYARLGAPVCDVIGSADMISRPSERNWVFGQVRNHFGWA